MDRPVCIVKGMSTERPQGSARERLLAAATELFYAEGIHTVGIDRVIARAGVAKASLYSTFGSKDELVRAYLEDRAAARRTRYTERLARHADPRDRILALFDLLAESVVSPSYRGCAFMNASAEGPRDESPVTQVARDTRSWVRGLLIELAREAGAGDPERVGRQIVLLYDGAAIGAAMDRDPAAVVRAREMAATLLAGACPAPAAAP